MLDTTPVTTAITRLLTAGVTQRHLIAVAHLPPARQMMVATIIILYRGEPDKTWLSRLSNTWHAADAVAALLESGALRD
jgi:hypothetical protein